MGGIQAQALVELPFPKRFLFNSEGSPLEGETTKIQGDK